MKYTCPVDGCRFKVDFGTWNPFIGNKIFKHERNHKNERREETDSV